MSEKLSPHFTFEELTTTNNELLLLENRREAKNYKNSLTRIAKELLEPIRIEFGPITINSGFRTKKLNESVGGSSTSQHCNGEAADFNVKGKQSREGRIEVIKWIIKNIKNFGQCLLERGVIHISLGTKKEVAEYATSFV